MQHLGFYETFVTHLWKSYFSCRIHITCICDKTFNLPQPNQSSTWFCKI